MLVGVAEGRRIPFDLRLDLLQNSAIPNAAFGIDQLIEIRGVDDAKAGTSGTGARRFVKREVSHAQFGNGRTTVRAGIRLGRFRLAVRLVVPGFTLECIK